MGRIRVIFQLSLEDYTMPIRTSKKSLPLGPLRILVCGGRDYKDLDKVYRTLYKYQDMMKLLGRKLILCHGGAKGADWLVGQWAKHNRVECVEYPADWEAHGKSAGPVRNRKMLNEFKPDVVVAFPGGSGTADMVGYARKQKVAVREIDE